MTETTLQYIEETRAFHSREKCIQLALIKYMEKDKMQLELINQHKLY